MKIITRDDIQKLDIDYVTCYQWGKEVIKSKKNAILPPKISIKTDEVKGFFFNIMPSLMGTENVFGVKVVTRYPDREVSIMGDILLYELKSGELLALMDGTWITNVRTAVVAVHSMETFAVNDYDTITMIGLGNIAFSFLSVLRDILPHRRFIIKLKKYKDQHVKMATSFIDHKNFIFEYCDDDTLLKGSQVIISAVTYAEKDFFQEENFENGVTVIPIHTRGFSNCDLSFDKVFVDDIEHVRGFKNFDRMKVVNEVCDVVNKNVEGRKSQKERILVYNIGISIQDVYFAKKIYEKYIEKGYNDEK